MAGHDASTRARVERTGLGLVETDAGLAALEGLMLQAAAAMPAQAAAVPIRWPRFLQQQFKGTAPPMFAAFADQAAVVATMAPAAAARSAVARPAPTKKAEKPKKHKQRAQASPAAGSQSAADREAFMLQQVQEAVAAVLGTSSIDPQQPLMEAGLDSLSSVELRNSLESKLGAELPTTLVFDYPTMAALAGFLASKVSAAGSAAARRQSSARRRPRRKAAPKQASAAIGDATVSAEAHQAFMLQQVQDAVAAVLGTSSIDPQQPLMEAGLDSLSSVELRNSLEAKLGAELPSTLVFDYPTSAALAGFLASKVQPGGGAGEGAAKEDSLSGCSSAYSEESEDEEEAAPIRRARRSKTAARRRSRPAAAGQAAAVSAEQHQAFMLQQVQEAVAAVLGTSSIDPQQPLMEAGLDSLSSVELRNSLEAKLGAELPTTLVFDYPTMAALAGFLASKIPAGAAAEVAPEGSASESESWASEASYSYSEEEAVVPAGKRSRSLAAPARRAQSIAVTGWVVRAPADAFAGLAPVDAVQMVPASRWDLEAHAGRGAVI